MCFFLQAFRSFSSIESVRVFVLVFLVFFLGLGLNFFEVSGWGLYRGSVECPIGFVFVFHLMVMVVA